MKLAFNPSTVAALTAPPNNKDITFDLRGQNIFARGVKFCGTDTNTWRDIKINNVSIGSNTLNLQGGNNTTLTNINGVVTINSTWRPVVDNLTSNSTTSSLSANQGRVLKALIDNKSNSDHNHDSRYVKKSGDTMLGALNFANGTWNLVGNNVYMGDHNIGGQLCIMGANSTTGLSFHKYGNASIRKSITFDGNTLYMNGSCDYATLSNQTNLLAINTVPNKTTTTSIGSWSPISGRYVFHQKWKDTSTGSNSADFGIYLDGNLTANMVLNGYYNSLLGFRVIGATGGFLKANGTIDNSTYLTSHQSLSNYYTKSEINNQFSKYKLKSSIWVPETRIICTNFRDFLTQENLHKQSLEELNLYRFYAGGDESNYSKYNYPVIDSHAMVFSIDGNNSYIRSMNFDIKSNDVYVTSRASNGQWRGWDRLLNTSDVAKLKDELTVHQYLSKTDTTWYPILFGGSSHNNTSDSTGSVYKSYDSLAWQTSSQVLWAPNIHTCNIKSLSVGGGFYWYPHVAYITVAKSGIEGGNTLVLKSMNDDKGTIQFQTNTTARLYHNNYPILTTQNTYVSNNKGYINNTEITQVNNSDTVDGYHASSLWRSDGATWNPNADVSLTASGNNQEWSFNIRRNGHTGCYWNVWDSDRYTILRVNADDGKVYAPYNFVGNLEGDASRVYGQVGNTGSHELVRCTMNSDQFRIIAGSNGGNNGWAEIATADDGCEPIYVRQYDGVFSTVRHTLTLLDENGDTTFPCSLSMRGQIIREGRSTQWIYGRDGALLRETSAPEYHTLWSLKTTNGSWDFGEYNFSGWSNIPVLSYITDSNYNSGNDVATYRIKFPLASGTVALTSYGGDFDHPIFLGCLNLEHGNDGTVSSSFYCLGYSIPFTYSRGGNYCKIFIPDTTQQTFYIRAAIASVNYSGGGMDTWTGNNRGQGAWWLHCYAYSSNEVRVKGFCQGNSNNDSWWGGNPLWSGDSGANRITVCIFGHVYIHNID